MGATFKTLNNDNNILNSFVLRIDTSGIKHVQNWKMSNFHMHFLNMDISLIMRVKCFTLFTHDARTHLGGRVSQKFDLGFSF